MFQTVYVTALPLEESPRAVPPRIDGPYALLPQAEYAARIWAHLEQAAEIVAAGPHGPWWVRVEGVADDRGGASP